MFFSLPWEFFWQAGKKRGQLDRYFPDINTYKQEVQQAAQSSAPTSLETWTYNVGYNMIYAAGDWLLCLYSCPTNQTSNGRSTSGLQGLLAAGIGTLYQKPPASGIEYLAYLKSNIGLGGQPAYAVGNGTDLLDPIVLKPWQDFRNVSYIFFVIIFVAVGFMIMFRFKINPQVVASVQDSLPKIVVALILVTLSYAIAGFMIDIAWVGNELVKNVIAPGNNIFGSGALFGNPAGSPPGTGAQDFPSAWPFDILAQYGSANGIVGILISGLGNILKGALTTNPNDAFVGLFGLILAFTVIGATFKIFFSLLTKYITLIVMAIFLPLAFLWGSLPGQEDTSSKSIMTLVSAALSFPAVTLFLALAYYFAKIGTSVNEIPPLYYQNAFGSVAGTGAGVGATSITANLIAIGILTIIPNIPSVIDDALQVKAGGALGAGVQQLGGALGKLPIVGSFLG
ncbi:MAG: hypothetical protein M1120_02430 [Patescibacteria group bacterium]|nr:hypothetical protein [Patescibacteria group bacterium]